MFPSLTVFFIWIVLIVAFCLILANLSPRGFALIFRHIFSAVGIFIFLNILPTDSRPYENLPPKGLLVSFGGFLVVIGIGLLHRILSSYMNDDPILVYFDRGPFLAGLSVVFGLLLVALSFR